MPFNTYTFVVFFVLVCVLYYAIPFWKARKGLLLIASYVFYSSWNPVFVLLLAFSTIVDWLLAKKIYSTQQQARKKRILIASLFCNLGLLSYFKYGEFFVETSVALLAKCHLYFSPQPLDIVLPVGISFYTFQTLSYTIDVYRGKISPAKSFFDYALYVSFFPQLVAGPIVRATFFLPQCRRQPDFSFDALGWGLGLITIGLFMKTVLADVVFSPIVDAAFTNPETLFFMEAWLAVFSFSGQIFCDFSGYSTIAIGTAMCLGFVLPDNFRSPYAAIGFRDFWRRWHISLSSWLRDYLYIPLGGNRGTPVRTYVNLLCTMLIGGLWHGASWMFVLWGGLHGLYLVVERLFVKLFVKNSLFSTLPSSVAKYIRFLGAMLTFLVVSITWVFFRAEDLSQAQNILTALYNTKITEGAYIVSPDMFLFVVVLLVLMFGWQFFTRNSSLEDFFGRIHFFFRSIILSAMILSIYLFASGDNDAFIYFQF